MIIEFANSMYNFYQIISISQPILKGGEYLIYLHYTGGCIATEGFKTEDQAWKRYNELKNNIINFK